MKPLATILQFLVVLCIHLDASEPSLPTVEEFLTLSPERADEVLNTTLGAYQIGNYVQAASASGRTDLVMACFKNKYSFLLTPAAIAALPESPQRDEWTILMLKSPSRFWPWEDIDDASGLIPKEVMDEPFASLVRRLLPGHPIGDEAVSTREKRLKLAAELEAALGKTRPTKDTQDSPPGGAAVEHPSGAPSTAASQPQPPPEKPAASTPWWVWFGILGVLIGVLYVWLKRRK